MLLFYSRNPENSQKLDSYCKENSVKLISKSLIEFQAVHFDPNLKLFDVVFFASPRAVDFFLNGFSDVSKFQIACIGESTKKHIENIGIQVDFFGEDSTNPALVAVQFKAWVNQKKVLFPISNQSNHSISNALPKHQFQEIIVYKTIAKTIVLTEKPDLIIFSSPSNARAYLNLNAIRSNQKVICYGQTTHKFLLSHGIEAEIIAEPNETGVISFLRKHLRRS
jgi:uroporphyrinogen-III synthase